MSMFGQFATKEMQKILPDQVDIAFVIRTIDQFESKNGNHFINFGLEVTDMDGDLSRFNGMSVKVSFPIFPDMDDDALSQLTDGQRRYFFTSGDEMLHVLRTLGVSEDDLDNPDWSTLTGLKITGRGKAYDDQHGKGKEWKLWKKTVRLSNE